MVVATPRVDTDEQDICAPVPIQERLSADDSASNLATDLVYTLLATRVSRWDMHSLGYGYGQHRRGATCQKYGKCVFWFGFVVPSTVRRSGCAELSDVANFSSPIWIDIRRWHALHSGQVVSSSKARMVMQVTLALSAKVGVNNPIVAQAHRELSEQGTSQFDCWYCLVFK